MGIPGCGIVSGVSTADNRGLSVLGPQGEATALARHDNYELFIMGKYEDRYKFIEELRHQQ
jgi:hypothetical protein